MQFEKGNEYWKLRTKDGRDRIYTKPEELADAANGYFQFCIDNPMLSEELFHSQGLVTSAQAKKMRPFTLTGLCNYIDIAVSTFQSYEKNPDFSAIITRIRQIIETQQFEGAASGFLNPNIIARKLGLTDKSEVRIVEEQPLFPE